MTAAKTNNRTVSLSDFLTDDEIDQCFDLQKADSIRRKVIEPNINRINKALGGENDPGYLAYAVSWVMQEASAPTKQPKRKQ